MQNIILDTFEEEAIFLNGYIINKELFQPVYLRANKNDIAWKAPRSIKSLIENPSLLFAHSNFILDESAMSLELSDLKNEMPKEVEKIEYVFNHANNIFSTNYENLFNKDGDIERILKVMDDLSDHDEFSTLIEPMEKAYGTYAYPNNMSFEMLNAGVTKIFSEKKPNFKIMDDFLRSPIYELTNNINIKINEIEDLHTLLDTAKKNINPLPYFGNDWSPIELVKKLNSNETKQLRRVLKTINSENMDIARIDNLLEEAKELSKFISSTGKITTTFFDFIVRASIITGISISIGPIYYIPSVIKYGAATYFLGKDTYNLVDYLDNVRVAKTSKWYNIISYIMYLNKMKE